MSDVPAASEAPASGGAPPAAAESDKPSITPSDAGRALRGAREGRDGGKKDGGGEPSIEQLRADRKAALRGDKDRPAKEEPADKKAEAKDADKEPAKEPEKKADEKDKEPEKKAEPKKGVDDEELAHLIAEDRRIKGEAKKLEAEKAAVESAKKAHEATVKEYDADVQIVKQGRTLLAKGDLMGAMRAILPEAQLNDLYWAMVKAYGSEEDEAPRATGPALTEDELVERAAAKLEAKRKAEEEAAEAGKRQTAESRQAAITSSDEAVGEPGFGRAIVKAMGLAEVPNDVIQETVSAYATFYDGAVRTFNANKDKFPAIARWGAKPSRVVQESESLRGKLKRQPSVVEVLSSIEAGYRADIEATGYAKPSAAPQKPAATVTPDWRSDPGRPSSTSNGQPEARTVEQIRNERKAKLRAGARN